MFLYDSGSLHSCCGLLQQKAILTGCLWSLSSWLRSLQYSCRSGAHVLRQPTYRHTKLSHLASPPSMFKIVMLFIKSWLACYGLTQLIMSAFDEYAWSLDFLTQICTKANTVQFSHASLVAGSASLAVIANLSNLRRCKTVSVVWNAYPSLATAVQSWGMSAVSDADIVQVFTAVARLRNFFKAL